MGEIFCGFESGWAVLRGRVAVGCGHEYESDT
jgi:hypothetical protein